MQPRRSDSTRALVLLVVLGATGALLGCSEGSPVTPTRSPSPPAQPGPIDANTNAAVAIEDASVVVYQLGSRFGYDVRFLLRETGGRSGATVLAVGIFNPDQSDVTGRDCWRDPLRVPPGGVLDTFHTDAGQYWLAYCSPGSAGYARNRSLTIAVTFADDEGRLVEAQSKVE